jgi:cell division protein ZapB
MTMNRIIPVIGGIILLVALAVVFKSQHRKPRPDMMTELPQPPAPDADTPADTVRSLSAKVASLVEETRKLTEENQRLREQNRTLRLQEERIISKVRSQLSGDIEQAHRRDDSALSSLKAEINRLRTRLSEVGAKALNVPSVRPTRQRSGPRTGLQAGSGGIPVGFGYESTSGAIHWIEPIDISPATNITGRLPRPLTGLRERSGKKSLLRSDGEGGSTLLSDDGPLSSRPIRKDKRKRGSRGRAVDQPASDAVQPLYTIPANATLIGSTAFSALVGRVPVGGQVQDPMPFKILVGEENLAANGHKIPGLEGIVMSGYAVGDWTLSCVRGYVTSATFVFTDGHVQVFGEKKKRNDNKNQEGDAIGWISDQHGVPCVSGTKITNAPAYLTQRIGITAMEAAAEAAAAAQTTTWSSPVHGGSSTSVDGDQGTFILGKTLSDAADEVGTWLEERMANSFDAIFAPAGTIVAIHLDITLPIDYDPAGRMLDHRASTTKPGGAYGHLD